MRKKRLAATLLLAGLLGSAAPASAVVIAAGELTVSDPTWLGTGTGDAGAYDLVRFSVDTDGLYNFAGIYPGDPNPNPPLHLDGYLALYQASFDPDSPGLGEIAFDDDGPAGSQTSLIQNIALTAGTDYFLVITSYDDAPSSFGQPFGNWLVDASGPGEIIVGAVPLPAAAWLLMSATLGLVAMGRKRRVAAAPFATQPDQP